MRFRRLWTSIHLDEQSDPPQKNPHRREAIQVFALLQDFHQRQQPKDALPNSLEHT